MKTKINKYRLWATAAIIFTSATLVTSCKNALLEAPKSLAVETFYNTPAEVEAAVNASYTPFRHTIVMGDGYMAQLESYVDYGLGRGSYAELNEFQGLGGTNVNRVGQAWTQFYQSIRNSNLVIKNAPKGKAIDKADIDKFVAEAKFMRAFAYFQLVRNWGGVPIRTEANMSEIDAKRNSEAEVFSLIESDLMEAEVNLPDVAPIAGRPTKWSAKTLLADALLWQKKYALARDKAYEVIQSNKYSLVRVSSSDDFQKIFGPDVITTTEEVFYIKCTRSPNLGNYFVMFLNHPGTRFHNNGGFYAQYSLSTLPFFVSWDNNDLRKGLWYPYNIGVDANTILSKKYIDPQAVAQTGAGNDVPWYRYADVLLIYAEAANQASSTPPAAAMEALNHVHRRAYGLDPTVPSSIDFNVSNYDKESFSELVSKEYGYEFQYEGKRWLELKRTGRAQSVIQQMKGKTIAQKHYLWPIPILETNFNKAIDPVKDQNPGY
ncbi:RagB/SusD family nutrient uptake outer membrane protein [Desertivirga xinjiangensis]|uniref:RagB/SusD family nutrient uptake outer membrane protein n=1 Tax=Desertivirga xinjiangensis TaxID=539206 RepID=UPI00210EA827|nr:RagB/SusD family nutrient uptake outer membrane protein [Pedobacter xinjiangensis]